MAMEWYAVHTYSGFEEKVKLSIEDKIKGTELEDMVEKILIPSEKVLEVRGGKRKERDRKFYPGYILVRVDLTDETWHLIKNTPRVTGFVGGQTPMPVPQEEVEQILQQVEKGGTAQVKTQFSVGDSVRINDGPFTNFTGSVEEVDAEHGRLRVMVSIFSRQTPVELNFFQVEKA